MSRPPRSLKPCPFARSAFLVAALLGLGTTGVARDAGEDEDPSPLPPGPDFEQVLSLERVGSPAIAPDGSAVAYTRTKTDWDENGYDTEIWLARQGQEPFQLTRTREGGSSSPAWSPDGRWIAFFADRGDGRQIQLIGSAGGEALQLTNAKGIARFEWSPDGQWLAVTVTEPEGDDDESREERYGKYEVEDAEYRMTHLWLLDVAVARSSDAGAELPPEPDEEDEDAEAKDDEDPEEEEEEPAFRRLTGGDDFTVGSFAWSPDSRTLAFDHRPDPLINSSPLTDLSKLDVESGEITSLVERDGFDGRPLWSPDGVWILFSTSDGETAFYLNDELARLRAGGGEPEVLTAAFDEDPRAVAWLDDGIRFTAYQKTHRSLFRLAPDTGVIERITETPRAVWSVDYTKDGRHMAMSAEAEGELTEIYRTAEKPYAPARLTDVTAQIAEWPLGTREVIEWSSEDGATIEGILFKPADFDPGQRHPLMVIIHGGPTGISMPSAVSGYVYPVQQWLAKGALVLMPNYRGSAGYGEKFRSLNVRNLGVGDAWDVNSGVDHLIAQGIVDPERMGAMGWSQGGYISAFLTTTTDRFKAISVGAGISNWMTYYVNTDIHPFTRHYLESTPWEDPDVYAKTSPMTYIKGAKTPTLIQHGEFDRRVPIANAYELFQGLQDLGVEARLVVYKGFGHGISKPKERLAATWHNWQWFAKHVWGEEVELPLE